VGLCRLAGHIRALQKRFLGHLGDNLVFVVSTDDHDVLSRPGDHRIAVTFNRVNHHGVRAYFQIALLHGQCVIPEKIAYEFIE